MEITQTITLTEAERETIADAFELIDEMSDVIKVSSVYDICSWFCRNIRYENASYIVPECININEMC